MKNPEDMTDDELEAAENAANGDDAATTTDDTTGTTMTGEGGEATQTGEATTEQQTTTEQTGTAGEGADTTTTGEAAAQTSAGAETAKVAGVASKDGTRVLPYSALQAERRSARQAAARAERAERDLEAAKKEIEDLRAGKSTDSGELTEEEVQRMEADFPEVGARLRAVFERNQELAKQVKEAKPAAQEATNDEDDPVQEAIDQIPLLVEWQHDPAHADKWNRAIAIDNVLKDSRKWKDKDAIERFAHVAQMVAEEFDIEVPGAKPAASQTTQASSNTTTTAKQTPDPKKAVESATRQPPSTLSDFKGGSVPDHDQVNLSKMPPQQMLQRFMDMDPDAIDRELAKLG